MILPAFRFISISTACFALLLCFQSIAGICLAVELADGLNLDGQKVISYKLSNSAENNQVKQNLKVNLKGNINENITTDLKIDDSLSEKVERMRFEYSGEKLQLELGDINFSGITGFSRSEKKMRGLVANLNGITSDKDQNLTFLCTYENGRPAKDQFTGEGRCGPFKLSAEKIVLQSDRVYIDGVLKRRNIDYGLDCENGILTFNEEVPLGSEIYIQYSVETSFENVNRYSFGAFSENKLSEKGMTKVGVMRSEESSQNGYALPNARTEFNLSQDIKLTEKLDTSLEYSRSFKDSAGIEDASRDGAALNLYTKLKGRYIDTNLKHTLVDTNYVPYHSGYVKPEKKSEFSFDLHPSEEDGILSKINGSVGVLRTEPLKGTLSSDISDEDKFFGKFLYNLNENVSLNTNFSNSANSEQADLKVSSRSSKLNIENGVSVQRKNGGADELNIINFRASTFPVNKNVYFVEYNDSALKTYSKVKDETNEFNFKLRRKVNNDVSLGYSLMQSGRMNLTEARMKMLENRAMMDYNLNEALALTGQVAAKNEKRTNAFEPAAALKGFLFGVKYNPLDFLKVLFKREYWDTDMPSRDMNFQKTDDSVKLIFAGQNSPYSLELKGSLLSDGYDIESGARRGGVTSGGALFNIKAGNRLKFSSEINQKAEEGTISPKILSNREEIKYKVNDDMDFFLDFEHERSLFTSINSTFKLEARL
ncbi:MAG TPA: hypothetical protein PKK26_05915 [Candidatus Wallbacteria bacterium]|nr:hypothetical protein [Candidatus Wallbacteria bacterium]